MTAERICSVHDLAPGESQRFDLGDIRIAVVRIENDWYAIGDRCSHQDVSLAEGEVHADNLELECFKHGSCFSLTSGKPSSLPATKAVPTYDLRIDGEDVLVVLP